MSSKILACVASVSARVRRKNWDESKKRVTPSPFIPLFCSRLSSQFYRRTRAETLATQATKIQPVAEFSRNRLFVINICNGMCIPKTFCVSLETTRTPTVGPVDYLCAAFLSFVLRGSRFLFFYLNKSVTWRQQGNPKTRVQNICPHTVKPCFTDTCLIWTPLYYGQFALSLAKENPYIFTIKIQTA